MTVGTVTTQIGPAVPSAYRLRSSAYGLKIFDLSASAVTGTKAAMSKWTLIAALTCLASAGCVERDITITSEPSGVVVEVSGREVGRTPVTIPFKWYGDYEIILRREGYKTLVATANINPPWYEIPPIDLLSDMAPWTYYDKRYLNYKLEKFTPPTTQQIIQRAEELRRLTTQPAKP